MARWIVALPLLMVGSLMFWGMAISLGGLSLMRAMTLSAQSEVLDGPAAELPDGYEGPSANGTIMVHLQESAEPQDLTGPSDVQDNMGAGGDVAPDEQSVLVPGPGSTSY